MTTEDLRWRGSREYRNEPTGSYTTNRNGKRVPVLKGTEYVRTAGAGTIPLAEWYLRMKTAVKEEGLEDLLQKIIEHCRKLAWLKTEQQVTEYALECMQCKAYQAWEGFLMIKEDEDEKTN